MLFWPYWTPPSPCLAELQNMEASFDIHQGCTNLRGHEVIQLIFFMCNADIFCLTFPLVTLCDVFGYSPPPPQGVTRFGKLRQLTTSCVTHNKMFLFFRIDN